MQALNVCEKQKQLFQRHMSKMQRLEGK